MSLDNTTAKFVSLLLRTGVQLTDVSSDGEGDFSYPFSGKRMWFAVGGRLDKRVPSGNCNED